MANQTVTTAVNHDSTSVMGLFSGETYSLNGGTLRVDGDVRWGQNGAVIGSVTISATLGGLFEVDGTQVWEIPFDASTGNVPALLELGSNGVTGGTSGATGELLRVWSSASTDGAPVGGNAIINTITRSGTTVTVTTAAPHNRTTAENVEISGAIEADYNGTFAITVTGETTFTYTIGGTPTTPATTASFFQFRLITAMPATGFIKLRSKVGTFVDNEVITLPGGATVTVNSATGGKRSWIHVVGAQFTTITVPRLGRFQVTGDWYELGTTNGLDDQQIAVPWRDTVPAIQIETAVGSGIYEWWLNSGDRWNDTVTTIPDDARGTYFGQLVGGTGDTTSGSPVIATTATAGVAIGMPLVISAGFAASSNLTVIAVDPGVSITVNANSNATGTGRTFSTPTANITLAKRTGTAQGFKPITGLRIRAPNVVLSSSVTTGGFVGQTLPSSSGDKWDLTTTASGVVDLDRAVVNIYLSITAAYEVELRRCALARAIIISNIATAPVIEDCGHGIERTVAETGFIFSNLFTGLTMTNVRSVRFSATGANQRTMTVTDCANVTFTDVRAETFGATNATGRGNASVETLLLLRCVNVTLTRPTFIGGRLLVDQTVNVVATDVRFADLLSGTTTSSSALSAMSIANTSADVYIDGFSNFSGLANVHPYVSILLLSTGVSDIEFRNLGTAAVPYNMGSALACAHIVSMSVCLNIRLYRLYADNTRSGVLVTVNTVQDLVLDNIWGDGGDSQAIAAINVTPRGCRWTNSTTGQSSVYGRHWEDAWTSTIAGRLLIACNEPLPATAAQVTTTFGASAGFTSTGQVSMPNLTDVVEWEMPYFMRGATSFDNSAPTVTGTNTGNFTLEFQFDLGSGYNGVWLALNGANLSGVGAINPTTGVKLKVRASVSVANATNALTYIRINTVTDATSQLIAYPLPLPQRTAKVTWEEPNSRVRIFNVTTNTEIYNAIAPGTSYEFTYGEGELFSEGDVVFVRVRDLGHFPASVTTEATSAGWSVFAPQLVSPYYTATTPANVTVDYINQKIRATGARDSFTAQELADIIIAAEYTEAGIRLPFIANINGLTLLSPGVFTALTIELRDWQVSWASGSVAQAFITGGNVVGGILGDPVEDVVGGPQVTVQLAQAGTVVTVGTIAPSEAQIKSWVQSTVIEGALTLQDVIRLLLAVNTGQALNMSGAAEFKSVDGTKTRVATTVTGANRAAPTLDVT